MKATSASLLPKEIQKRWIYSIYFALKSIIATYEYHFDVLRKETIVK